MRVDSDLQAAAALCEHYSFARNNAPLTEYEALLYEAAANMLAAVFRTVESQYTEKKGDDDV